MTTLLENPLPILFFAVITEAVLAAVLVSTRRTLLLVPMGIVAVLVLAGLALEWWVVAQREEVEATLNGVEAALESNDVDRVFQFVAPDASFTREQAEWALRLIEITDVKINNLEIVINDLTSPPTAEANFTGVLYFHDLSGYLLREYYASRFTVEFRKEADRWLITNHVVHEMQGAGARADRRD